MNKTSRLLATAAAVLALGSASLAWAQAVPDGAGRPGMGMHRGGHGHHGPLSAADVAARLAQLKTDLKITPAQEGAWKQFEDTARQQAAARETQRQALEERRKGGTPPDATERQALRDKMRQQHEADRAARQKARDTLYAALSPEQKTVADQKLRQARGEGRGEGRGGHGHHRGDGPAPAKPQGTS